jgi:hypothetical protein
MTNWSELAIIENALDGRAIPGSIDEAFKQINPLTVEVKLQSRLLIVGRYWRMFRARAMGARPAHIVEIGAPPAYKVLLPGRLNDCGQSVLYLADSFNTALCEINAVEGQYCLSEWEVNEPKLACANGGLHPDFLAGLLPHDYTGQLHLDRPVSEREDELLTFIRKVFMSPLGGELYRWSIACGMANGFAHQRDLRSAIEANGNTWWEGAFPMSAIAYSSIRTDQIAVNYAMNDVGMRCVVPRQVQWVRLTADGVVTGLDFADSWNLGGNIEWQDRPANVLIADRDPAYEVSTGKRPWKRDSTDEYIPEFS